jgi:hypothetical protein
MCRRLTALAATLMAVIASPALAVTISFVPAKDNTLVQSTNPAGQLSNGQGDIFIGRTNQDGGGPAATSIRRGLVEFNLAGPGTNGQSIPAGATITGVTLTMRDVMGGNGDHPADLHRVTREWGEGASFSGSGGGAAAAAAGDATWLYAFYAVVPAQATSWATPGGDFDPAVSGSVVISDDLGAGQIFTWSSAANPAMVADVQAWVNNPANNHGWLIRGNESTGMTAKRLNSRESTTAPVLSVTFVPEPNPLALGSLAVVGAAMFRARRR